MIMKKYVNPTEGIMPVYADSGMTHKIGTLYKGSACQCICEHNDMAVILYKISNTGNFKVGFADPPVRSLEWKKSIMQKTNSTKRWPSTSWTIGGSNP